MIFCRTKAEASKALEKPRAQARSLGLVPTMGALHEGHMSLVRRSVAENDVTVVSVFVNPAQFDESRDLEKYPQDLRQDLLLCEKAGVDVVFAPTVEEMYPEDFSTWVEETQLSRGLCGAARPGHFRGVTTVVAKLFNIIRPGRAYFGAKDFQQAAVVRRMTRDLDMPVEIVVMPIVREGDGLAMSSRNSRLQGPSREEALVLSRALARAEELYRAGQRDVGVLVREMLDCIRSAQHVQVDYVEIVDAESLEPLEHLNVPALAAAAVYIGDTRLIDNRLLNPTEEGTTP